MTVSATPTAIGKYHVVERVGQGGMGTLYLARDPALDRLVAIKVLSVDYTNEELVMAARSPATQLSLRTTPDSAFNRSRLRRAMEKREEKLDRHFLGREITDGVGPWR